jgi:hypothetical protein
MKLYLLGWGYVAIAAALLYRGAHPEYYAAPDASEMPIFVGSEAGRWFTAIKPRCNSVVANLAVQSSPPPAGWEGAGYGAACYAIAGRIEDARALLKASDEATRIKAVGILFDVAHPVADAGDDLSAGAIMQLVVDFWPTHYMALYHAGAAQHRLGQFSAARVNLEAFLREYHQNDGWTANAKEMLAGMK